MWFRRAVRGDWPGERCSPGPPRSTLKKKKRSGGKQLLLVRPENDSGQNTEDDCRNR